MAPQPRSEADLRDRQGRGQLRVSTALALNAESLVLHLCGKQLDMAVWYYPVSAFTTKKAAPQPIAEATPSEEPPASVVAPSWAPAEEGEVPKPIQEEKAPQWVEVIDIGVTFKVRLQGGGPKRPQLLRVFFLLLFLFFVCSFRSCTT